MHVYNTHYDNLCHSLSAYYVSGIGLDFRGNYNMNIIPAHIDFSMLVGGGDNIFGATRGPIVKL